MRKRVYIAYTGGTIGMKRSAEGYAPAPGYLQAQMAVMPELQSADMPEYEIQEYAPLLDSSNMLPSDWLRIAQDIAARYEDYDGFLVLHGTDTMAYTASALPFMLSGLKKPVVVTGSQIPLCEVRNDARDNIITALMIASRFPIPEVCLYFHNRLLRGCRAVKVDADGLLAFDSPNYPLLGAAGVDIVIDWSRVLSAAETEGPLQVRGPGAASVGVLRLFPGISADVLRNVLRPPLQGLILEAYGVGNGPDRNREFLAVLTEATDRGVVIVACSQCLRGTVSLGDYATGAALANAGVISGLDMTAEAALAKMFTLFQEGYAVEEVKLLLQQNLRGELTPAQEGRDIIEG